jgi:hypothetical protein
VTTAAFAPDVIFEELNRSPAFWTWGVKNISRLPKPHILPRTLHAFPLPKIQLKISEILALNPNLEASCQKS